MMSNSKQVSTEALGSTWSSSDLTRLSRCIVDWESIAPVLAITEAEEREIKEDNLHDYQTQKYVMLQKWKSKAGEGATYGQLIRVFRSIREMGLVEHVHAGPAEANFHWTGSSLIFIFIAYNSAPLQFVRCFGRV